VTEAELRGRLITRLRENRLWTREKLAREAGVSTTTVSQAETGRTLVRLGTVRKLAEALDVDPIRLLHPEAEKVVSPKASAAPLLEWSLSASEEEFDSWVKTAQASDLHKLWNMMTDHAQSLDDMKRRDFIRDRAQKAIDQFLEILPIADWIDRREQTPVEREEQETA
jgi:transcriptional regulator with XRE-family HTH domain